MGFHQAVVVDVAHHMAVGEEHIFLLGIAEEGLDGRSGRPHGRCTPHPPSRRGAGNRGPSFFRDKSQALPEPIWSIRDW